MMLFRPEARVITKTRILAHRNIIIIQYSTNENNEKKLRSSWVNKSVVTTHQDTTAQLFSDAC